MTAILETGYNDYEFTGDSNVSGPFQRALDWLFGSAVSNAAPEKPPLDPTAALYKNIQAQLNKTFRQMGLTRERTLGEGGYGSVFLSKGISHIKDKALAIKTLNLEEILWVNAQGETRFYEDTTLEQEDGEAATLFLPKGKHLARAYGVFVWDKTSNKVRYVTKATAKLYKNCPIIAMISRAQAQDLSSLVGSLSTEAIAGYGKQIAEAIHAFHLEGRLHRDIKPPNILIKEGEGYRVKLADFGLSTTEGSKRSGLGTPTFQAPEVRQSQPFGTPADWYSFGVTLYMMATGKVTPLDLEDIADDNLRDLLTGLLNADPSQRLSGPDILNHPFFN